MVTDKIDKGDIIFTKDVFISKENDTPIKINECLQRNNRVLLKDFLISYFIKKRQLNIINKMSFGSYLPRLKSKINGWIDWSLDVYELDRFIGAFEKPYPGAKTMLHGKEVVLRNVQMSCMDSSKHSFENGMVLRNFLNKIVISVKGGSLYVGNVMYKNKDIMNKIVPGDIFYTNIKKLDLNKRKNIYVLKDKLIYNNKNNYLKKLKIK